MSQHDEMPHVPPVPSTLTLPRRRGRPAKPDGAPRTRKVVKNVSLDEDAAAMLGEVAASMEAELGFRPTLSQALKRLISKSNGIDWSKLGQK